MNTCTQCGWSSREIHFDTLCTYCTQGLPKSEVQTFPAELSPHTLSRLNPHYKQPLSVQRTLFNKHIRTSHNG